MFKSGVIRDIILFLIVLVFLLAVIPVISSIFKQLIILQAIILIVGTVALSYLVRRVRSKGRK